MLRVNDIQEMVMIMRRTRMTLWESVCGRIDHACLAEKRGNSSESRRYSGETERKHKERKN